MDCGSPNRNNGNIFLNFIFCLSTALLEEAQTKPFAVHPTVASEIINSLYSLRQGESTSRSYVMFCHGDQKRSCQQTFNCQHLNYPGLI